MRHPTSLNQENRNSTSVRSTTVDAEDIVMSSDGEPSSMNSLPPHIAARFYRQSSARRKSSATSSRRNSISSLKSNRSGRSAHGGPQSSHLAQHLRRASIIESRKARLADKAAHAEQVRLRAALAKAAPRACTTREDRALAAQQARERYLAQVAASCAEEVKRAKKVAEDMKEKKAAEHLKLKDDMAERLADAERRRILYQQNLRRGRYTNLQPVEEKKVALPAWKPPTEAAAVRLIHKAWRNFRRKQTIKQYLQLGLTVEKAQQMSFEDFSSCLAKEEVLFSTAKVLKLYGLQDGVGGGLGENTAVRVFLSAYLIVIHPQHVLSQQGEQEQDLIGKANNLLVFFEHMISRSSSGHNFSHSPTQTALLSEVYVDFQTAFAAWKNHDSSILISTMVAQFVELDVIWQTVKNDADGHVADDYKEGIQKNQTLLLVRLKRLAGPEQALKMVSDAVRARRKSKLRKPQLGDVKPREAPSVIAGPSQENGDLASQVTLGAEPFPVVPETSQANQFEKITRPLPDNRTIVHELAIDEGYRIDVSQQTGLRAELTAAIFDRMRKDLETGHGDQWIISMAATIRERLLRVVAPGKSLHTLISETLDLGLIGNQLKVGNFSYEEFFSFMNTILPKLCAPVRDPEVKALAADRSEDFIGRLAKLMHIIDMLSLDYANYQLKIAAPGINARSADYEKRCFSEQIKNLKLTRTTHWWERARSKRITENTRRTAEDQGNSPSPSAFQPNPDKVYSQGLVDLFIAVPPLETDDVPETLELDRQRILRVRTDILRIITIGTVLLTAKNLLKRDVRSQWKAEAQRMWDLPSAFDDAAPYLTIIESAHALPPSTRTSLQGTIDRVLGDARDPQAMTHPVMKVLLQKLKNNVMGRLGASSAEGRLRTTTTASEVVAGSGMVEFIGRIGGIVEEMGKVKSVDWAAHGKWLDEVAEEVARVARRG